MFKLTKLRRVVSLSLSVGVLVVAISGLSSSASALSGSQFKPGRIIDDALFYQSSSMSSNSIQTFLNSKVPTCDTNGTQMYNSSMTRAQYGKSKGYPAPYTCLKSYKQNTPAKNAESGICGNLPAHSNRTAALIISDVSSACGVSPKVLLVLLQKEEGLVTDDWPWPSQYKIAAGFGCPDSGTCNSEYYGFFNQVYHAARQYKLYRANPTNYNFVAGQNNDIQYNPSASCGTKTVYIQNQATAGLYDYTPYVPNAAALNNLNGTGDSCSAYGNRNFWRYYNEWFGPTLVDVVRARPDTCGQAGGNCTQYVIYDGVKQGIPSNDVLNAWGINNLPLQSYSTSALASIPDEGSTLSRFAKSSATGNYYFVDGGQYFSAGSSAIRKLWGFPSSPATAGSKLFGILNKAGGLSPYVSPQDGNTIALIDGSSELPFSSPSVLSAWRNGEGVTTISSQYFGNLSVGDTVANNRITSGGSDYVVVNGSRYTLPAGMASSYPFGGAAESVSANVLGYLNDAGALSRFIRSDHNGSVYLLNGGKLYGLPSPSVWAAYAAGTSKTATDLGTASFDLVPQATTLRTSVVKRASNGNYYVLWGGTAKQIPSGLLTNYNASALAFTLDDYYFSVMDISSQQATDIVTASNTPGVFLLDAGQRLGISNPTTLKQLLKPGESVTDISPYDLGSYTHPKNITNYLGTASQRYFVDGGTTYPISADVATDWGLDNSDFTTISNPTLSSFNATATNMSNEVKIGASDYVVSLGHWYKASTTYASIWGFPSSGLLDLSSSSLFRVKSGGVANRFASNGGTIFTVDSGSLIGIPNLDSLHDLGYSGQLIIPLPDHLTSSMYSAGHVFNGYLAHNSSNVCYVFDNGAKRQPVSASAADWCYDTAGSTLFSNTYLSLLPNGSHLTKSIRAEGGRTLYAIKTGTKRWIPSNAIYYKYFSPFTTVSGHLRNTLPTGATIGSDGN